MGCSNASKGSKIPAARMVFFVHVPPMGELGQGLSKKVTVQLLHGWDGGPRPSSVQITGGDARPTVEA